MSFFWQFNLADVPAQANAHLSVSQGLLQFFACTSHHVYVELACACAVPVHMCCPCALLNVCVCVATSALLSHCLRDASSHSFLLRLSVAHALQVLDVQSRFWLDMCSCGTRESGRVQRA
jgi:hypothetical protein